VGHWEKNNKYAKRLKSGFYCIHVPLLEASLIVGGLVASTLVSNTMVKHQSISLTGAATAPSILLFDQLLLTIRRQASTPHIYAALATSKREKALTNQSNAPTIGLQAVAFRASPTRQPFML
jgi:hypothetical protein